MPGVATPSALSTLPPKRPWSDSTRPIAATSGQDRWQSGSASAITASARLYAAIAAAGMPFADAEDGSLGSSSAGWLPLELIVGNVVSAGEV